MDFDAPIISEVASKDNGAKKDFESVKTIDNNKELTCEQSLNVKSVWGCFVAKLKSLNLITLYTACGEIRDICFSKNTLIVRVKEESLFSILTKENNKQRIESYLKQIDERIEVKFEKILTKNDAGDENLNKLKIMFKDELKFK